MPVFTARRTLDASSSTVENAGSSNDAFTSISSATLIRSGGSFLTSAADRTAASATARARCGSCLTPRRSRTRRRCHFPVSTAENAAVPPGSRRPRRAPQRSPRPQQASGSTRGAGNISAPARAPRGAHQTVPVPVSTPPRPRPGSSKRDPGPFTNRRNRGYAVRSIDATGPDPRSGPRNRARQMLEPELEIALRELTLDRPAPELVGELKDPSELDPQLARNALKPRDLTPLRAGQPLRAPTPQLPVVHVTPLKPLAVDPLRADNRRVIKHERLRAGLQQHRVMLTRVAQTPVDQRCDRRQHADRLPVRLATAVHTAEATLPTAAPITPGPQFAATPITPGPQFAATPITPGPQFAAIVAVRPLHLLGLCGPYPSQSQNDSTLRAYSRLERSANGTDANHRRYRSTASAGSTLPDIESPPYLWPRMEADTGPSESY